jgi:hypothetical protein
MKISFKNKELEAEENQKVYFGAVTYSAVTSFETG